MKIKKLSLIMMVLMIMAVVVGGASAQDAPPMPPERPDRPLAGLVRDLVQIVVDETGMEPKAILELVREGKSLAEIITESGGDVNGVIAKAVEVVTARINEAVASGQLPQERADQMLTNLEDVITRAVNGELRPDRPERPDKPERPERLERLADRMLVRHASELTGLDVPSILEQMRGGSSLADILTANGVDVDVFINDALTPVQTRLTEAVEKGLITQEQADDRLANLRERLTERINQTRPVSVEAETSA